MGTVNYFSQKITGLPVSEFIPSKTNGLSAGRLIYNENNEIVFNFGEHKGSTGKMDDGRWKKREAKYNNDITTILNSIENT